MKMYENVWGCVENVSKSVKMHWKTKRTPHNPTRRWREELKSIQNVWKCMENVLKTKQVMYWRKIFIFPRRSREATWTSVKMCENVWKMHWKPGKLCIEEFFLFPRGPTEATRRSLKQSENFLYFPEGHREIENAWKDVEIKFSYVPKKYVDISPRAMGSHMNFIETIRKCLKMW